MNRLTSTSYDEQIVHVLTVGLAVPDDVGLARRPGPGPVQRTWAATPSQRRAAVLRRAGGLLTEHAAEIAEWLFREAGSVRASAAFEVGLAIGESFECAGCRRVRRARH
jgi:benzaldehyde dehydrogenase (NAD)